MSLPSFSTRRYLSFFCLYWLIFMAGISVGYTQDDDLEAVLACDKIEEAADRLKCFDTVVEALKQKPQSSDHGLAKDQTGSASDPAPPPPVLAPTPEEAFGDPPEPQISARERARLARQAKLAQEATREAAKDDPQAVVAQPPAVQKPEKPKKLSRLTSEIRRFWKNNDDDYVIVLENGQIWQTLDASSLTIPQDPIEATIKRGFLGGYKMVVRNRSREGFSGKVKRIR